MIQHQVNDHAGNRNIHPHGQGPTRNRAMPQEVAAQCSPDGDNNERHDDCSQDRVRREYREIDRSSNSLPCKARRSVMRVIDDIGNQKHDRSSERGQLTAPMCEHASPANKVIAAREQDETRSIKRSIQMGEN